LKEKDDEIKKKIDEERLKREKDRFIADLENLALQKTKAGARE
jgi:hypothetical protein